jgi:hypothetical protein
MVAAPVVGAGGEHGGDELEQPVVVQAEVHEARAGDLDGGDVRRRRRRDLVDDRLGQLAGRAARGLGRGERDVAREVAVLTACGLLQVDGRRGLDTERPEGVL